MNKMVWAHFFVELFLVVVLIAFVVVALSQAPARSFAAPMEKAKVYEAKWTFTEKQLEGYVERQMVEKLLQEEKSLKDVIAESKNWHTVAFEDVKYTIYTGPGIVVSQVSFNEPK